MKQLIKVSNSELSFKLKLNYNNVYSRLRMLLGKSAGFFAEIATKSTATTWYSDDDADYISLSDAPNTENRNILMALNSKLKEVKALLAKSDELAPYAEDILEVPDNSYVFYRQTDDGYRFILAGWGCKQAHTAVSETGGLIMRVSKSIDLVEQDKPVGRKNTDIGDIEGGDEEDSNNLSDTDKTANTHAGNINQPNGDENTSDEITAPIINTLDQSVPPIQKKKKEQRVLLRVLNQNMKPVEDEDVHIRTALGDVNGITDENGIIEAGSLPYNSVFHVSFPNIPNIQERAYEVEPKVETYDAYIKKYVKYSPVLFVEDQNGNVVNDYNVKVVVSGQETVLNSGLNGMSQLPTMQEGQKFIVIDSANYANSEEYSVTSETVKKPFRFTIKRTLKTKIGITVLDKGRHPIENTAIDVISGENPCQQTTDKDGRAEFPPEIFKPGEVDLKLYVPGKGTIKSKLNFVSDTTEYTIQLTGKKSNGHFNWKWLLILPILLLLAFGGKMLYDHLNKPDAPEDSDVPTIAEMETGVCLILGQGFYYVDLNVPDVRIDGNPAIAYFNYDMNTKKVSNLTFDANKAKVQAWWGTGFLISKDGLIVTNKHIAAPAAPDEVAKQLKSAFQYNKDMYQREADRLNQELQIIGSQGELNQSYVNSIIDSLKFCQENVRVFDRLLNTGDFKVQVKSQTRVAFTNTRIEDYEDFIACSQPRAVGDPGGITEKDLAIIQIKKEQDIPKNAFIFTVPEKDIMDGEIPDNYEITVLGYNAGGELQNMKLQDGIKPQAQHGRITNRSEKYRVGYDAQTIGGSSGSPVINNKGELVAINNSGLVMSQGFNYGVRTKYLKELVDQLNKDKNKGTAETNDIEDNSKTEK